MMDSIAKQRLPVFALNTVLFPGASLALKVFEPRYVEMTKACLRDGTSFGVCLIREGNEVGDPALTASVGCTAHIAQWELPHPNLFELAAVGEQRFRIVASEVDALGLIVCEAELLPAEPSGEAPDALCASVLASAIEQFGADRFPAPIALDDAAWVSYRLAEILPLDASLKQQLLEIAAGQRLEILHDLLVRAGAHPPS
ncbi:MAG: LON peptidase substrate-binding domain-containing protein [Burkholderiales bacterium]